MESLALASKKSTVLLGDIYCDALGDRSLSGLLQVEWRFVLIHLSLNLEALGAYFLLFGDEDKSML